MAHVGIESALIGSARTLSNTPASGFSPRLPAPKRKALCCSKPIDGPTADVRVRQALNYAIDKDALAQSLYGGAAAVDQCQILSSTVFGFNPSLSAYDYNPDMARQLIAEAGAEGATIDLVGESGRWLKDRELIEAVANYLGARGVGGMAGMVAKE